MSVGAGNGMRTITREWTVRGRTGSLARGYTRRQTKACGVMDQVNRIHKHLYDHWMLEHKRFVRLGSVKCKRVPECKQHETINCLLCGVESHVKNYKASMESPLARLVIHPYLISRGYTPVYAEINE